MSVVIPALARGGTKALAIGQTVAGISKQTGQASIELLGYDFVNLGVKLLIFYMLALVIAKYMELVIGGTNFFKGVLGWLGFQAPNFFPQSFIDFYTNGYHGVKFWDVVKILSVALVAIEYSRYVTAQKALGGSPSAMTEGIFLMIIGFLLMITVPELWQRIKEYTTITETTTGGDLSF